MGHETVLVGARVAPQDSDVDVDRGDDHAGGRGGGGGRPLLRTVPGLSPMVPFPAQSLLAHVEGLAAQGRAVTLRVHVSRWRCGQRRCQTAIFADRLTGVTAPRVHHTHRFGAVGHLVGHALGGRGGERLLARLGMGISNDTILRMLKRPPAEPLAPDVLHVVGIDDWAWQKGQQQGRKSPAIRAGSRTAPGRLRRGSQGCAVRESSWRLDGARALC